MNLIADPTSPSDLGSTLSASHVSPPHAPVIPPPIRWLWPGVIPRGRITFIAGAPSMGKSLLALDLAAHVSRGTLPDARASSTPPDRCQPAADPASSLLFTCDDNFSDVITPRLIASGADLNRIHRAEGVIRPRAGLSPMDLLADADALERFLARHPDIALIVFDPFPAYLGSRACSPTFIRGVINRLTRLAESFDLAVLAVTHTSPSRPRHYHKLLGSVVYTTTARLIWLIEPESDGITRTMTLAKGNLDIPRSARSFTISDSGLVWTQPRPHSISFASLADLDDQSAFEEACQFLSAELEYGPRPGSQVLADARDAGVSQGTLRRAKHYLGIQSVKSVSHNGHWEWVLPG